MAAAFACMPGAAVLGDCNWADMLRCNCCCLLCLSFMLSAAAAAVQWSLPLTWQSCAASGTTLPALQCST